MPLGALFGLLRLGLSAGVTAARVYSRYENEAQLQRETSECNPQPTVIGYMQDGDTQIPITGYIQQDSQPTPLSLSHRFVCSCACYALPF